MRRVLGGIVALFLVAVGVVAASGPAGAAKPGGGGGKPTTTTTSSTTTSSTTSTTAAPSGRNPILFVHGWNSSGSVWTTMIDRFKADGYTDAELTNWSYNTSQSNRTTAEQIAQQVAGIKSRTNATKVDIISHSMGGLSSRHYAKFLSGQADLDDWVSLGGPNHGTDTANFCFSTACSEMRIGSSFLAELNAGDESPGSVNYLTWWSPCDTVINPDSSVSVSGARNTQTACLGHSDLYLDATVYTQVRDAVA